MNEQVKTFKVENAELIFRNFEGREGPMNAKGNRNFCTFLDPDTAAAMAADGWNIKELEPRDETEDLRFYIQIALGYKFRPPRVTLITSTSRTALDEESVEMLDDVEMETVDLIARGYDWQVGDKTGTKAYLQTMFVVLREDELERKWRVDNGDDSPTD